MNISQVRSILIGLCFSLSFSLTAVATAQTVPSEAFGAQGNKPSYQLETIASGLAFPWAMAFLTNGDVLVTERQGKIKVVRDGEVLANDVKGVPEVYFAGQGGLLDIMLDQHYAQNQRLYLSFAYGGRNANATRLVSAELASVNNGYELRNIQVLFTAQPSKSTAHHYGARIAQMSDGSLLMTVGDGFNYREQAQTLDNHFGKTIRVLADGSAPTDNPDFSGKKLGNATVSDISALPEIYSIGHRNQQALLVHGDTIYQHEHGPQGGDEVNVIYPGHNYGWPIATLGIDYTGARISPFSSYDGMESPKVDWTPSIAPSSMAMHKGDLYVTALAEKSIRKLSINGDTINDQGVVFKQLFEQLNERLRDIKSAPDGHLYVLTDGDNGRLIKINQR